MFTLAIQAGGESRRMGQNKALMSFMGKPLIQQVVRRLAGLADETFVIANRPELYAFLALPLYPDLVPGRGALGGLLTALRYAKHPSVAVVACDMPFASPSLLRYQVQRLAEKNVDVVAPLTALGLEPLHAIYRRETCLPIIEAAVAAGEWKVKGWLARVDVYALSEEEWKSYDPAGVIFTNLNTPDEFSKAEQYARSQRA